MGLSSLLNKVHMMFCVLKVSFTLITYNFRKKMNINSLQTKQPSIRSKCCLGPQQDTQKVNYVRKTRTLVTLHKVDIELRLLECNSSDAIHIVHHNASQIIIFFSIKFLVV